MIDFMKQLAVAGEEPELLEVTNGLQEEEDIQVAAEKRMEERAAARLAGQQEQLARGDELLEKSDEARARGDEVLGKTPRKPRTKKGGVGNE